MLILHLIAVYPVLQVMQENLIVPMEPVIVWMASIIIMLVNARPVSFHAKNAFQINIAYLVQ